jgi:hypothetical protein
MIFAMDRSLRPACAALALLVGPAVAPAAQSMAEAARREKQRRSKAAKPVKVYTDADLDALRASRPDPQTSSSVPADAAQAVDPDPQAAPRAEADGAEAAERERLEADWRIRFADARRRIAEAELRCWRSVVRTVFVAGIPVQQWVKEFEESEEFRQAKKTLGDLEEEFRKTGLPPGWTRE